MLERIRQMPGEILDEPSYRKDFRANWDQIEGGFWKLERIQDFREPGNDAWDAWVDGRWDDTLKLLEARRSLLTEMAQHDAALDIEKRRVRVVKLPLTPYMHWELTALKVHAEHDERIRVLEPAALSHLETSGLLPELVVLGTHVMYEVRYDDTGTLAGGRKILDPDVISACRTEMASLYEQAEDLRSFFDREIAHLPPPIPDHV